MAPFGRLHTRSCLSSIVTMSLLCIPLLRFSVEYWRDLEIWVRGRSSSLNMAVIDISYMTYYWSSIVTIDLSCTVFELFVGL